MLGNNQKNKMLIDIFQQYNERAEKLIGIDYLKATWRKYDRTKRFIQIIILSRYKADDLPIQIVDMQFVNDLELG